MINSLTLTGWLTADPIPRYAPGGAMTLCFKLHTKDSKDVEVLLPCFIDSPAVALRVEPLLLPGRGIVVNGEMTQREVIKNDRTKFIALEMRVMGCEVPNRSAVAKPQEAAPV
jgi:single-stranded DNA-binding protein